MTSTPTFREALGAFAGKVQESFTELAEQTVDLMDDGKVRMLLSQRTRLHESLDAVENKIRESALEELRSGRFDASDIAQRYQMTEELLDEWIEKDEREETYGEPKADA